MFEGIVATSVTPFDEKEEVFEDGIVALIDFLASQGIKNLFCLGSWGGFALMNAAERRRVAEISVSESRKRGLQTIVNVSHPATREAIRLAEHAESVGADAVVSLAPYYYPPFGYNNNNILSYFSDLISAVKLPVHFYNNPRASSFILSMDLFNRLLDLGLQGMKEGGGEPAKFVEMMYILKKRQIAFDMIPSSLTAFFPGALYGVKATMIGTAVFLPEMALALLEAFRKGDLSKAAQLHAKLMEIRRIQSSRGMGISACYGILRLRGVNVGYPRRPWLDLTEEDLAFLKERLREAGVDI